MVITQEGSKCRVLAFNPDSATIRDVASFDVSQLTSPDSCANGVGGPAGGPGGAPKFSPDFAKMAVSTIMIPSGGVSIGWIDAKGSYTRVSASETPDFGLPTQPALLGFNSRGEFFYTLDHGNRLESSFYEEMYRVPAGSSAGGQVVATIHEIKDSDVVRTADGWQFSNGTGCSKPSSSSYYGSEQIPWFLVDNYNLLRLDQSCGDQSTGRPIIPTTGKQISKFIWKMDGAQVLFELAGVPPSPSKLYIVDGHGTTAPREITGAGVGSILPPTIYFYSWI
ncbi:hypothetical protein [Mycobacterium gordonae]|uniref:hypothetical protein n=1 Tax=Mycobacterium gordonae TaxID=1778 RepID=UPI0011514F5B|nr:hypothetical protein [Mycobacterium gordonae]MCV7007965.1 hypothetical protein [Mycobacterium gordonae]